MAGVPAGLPAGVRLSDHISLGVIAGAVPLARVRKILAETGRASERFDRQIERADRQIVGDKALPARSGGLRASRAAIRSGGARLGRACGRREGQGGHSGLDSISATKQSSRHWPARTDAPYADRMS